MVSLGTAAAAGVTGGTLFQYNRKNFMYDRGQRTETEYQIMEYQIKKQDLFREDVRDIVELTAVKMDTCTIITVIQLGFCIVALCEGRMGDGTPPWLVAAHTLTLCTAFGYFLLSVWFAMHATIAANAYKVRLLTQVVRLPIPSWAQLEGARTYASSYEKTDARQMFRVPFMCGKQEDVAKGNCFPGLSQTQQRKPSDRQTAAFRDEGCQEDASSMNHDNNISADPWGLERPGANIYELDGNLQIDPRKLRHIQLVREAMQYWAASDAFARVCMSIGSQLFAIGLSYYVIGYLLIINHAVVAAWLSVVLLVSASWAFVRIDMSLTAGEYITAFCLLVISPLCILVSATLWAMDREGTSIQILMPFAYIGHILWLVFLVRICKVTEQKNGVMLPTGYRAVLYIDVFGWIKRNVEGVTADTESPTSTRSERLPEPDRLLGAGPAVQGVRYEGGRPVPMRVEQLAGANRPPRPADISKTAFAPSTFVPGVKDGEDEHVTGGPAGRRPWTVFFVTTWAFAALWFASGVVISMQLLGVTGLKLAPQLKETGPVTALLELERNPEWLPSGIQVSTGWPHDNVNPIGLACDGASNTMVVSSRYGLYTADLSNATHVQFLHAPHCEDVEGASLQDVSLECGTEASPGACQAIVLHQKGRRLARCALKEASDQHGHIINATAQAHSATDIAGQWLSSRTVAGKVHVVALAQKRQCTDQKRECLYVGTSDQRIVEMHESVDREGTRALFPKRVVGTKISITAPATGGGMDMIYDRYLGLLQRDGRRLQVNDLRSGGATAGLWRLPDHPKAPTLIPEGKTWTAMCAAGEHLYLLSEGLSPQLWRFPVPVQLTRNRTRDLHLTSA